MMKIKKSLLALSLALSGVVGFAHAADDNEGTVSGYKSLSDSAVQQAQDKLQATFSNIKFSHFGPAPIDGLFELHAGKNVLYFHPEDEVMFVGELYNKDGVSLTQLSKQKVALEKMKDLPMDSALELGDPDGIEIIEFGQPECGYCIAANKEIEELSKKYPIKRKYFFVRVGSRFPQSQQKVMSILCADDKAQAFHDAHNGKFNQFANCDEGKEQFAEHDKVVDSFGVNGTPTFLLGSRLVEGKNTPAIEEYVKEQLALRELQNKKGEGDKVTKK